MLYSVFLSHALRCTECGGNRAQHQGKCFHSLGSLIAQGNQLGGILSFSILTHFHFLQPENRTSEGIVHALTVCLRHRQDVATAHIRYQNRRD